MQSLSIIGLHDPYISAKTLCDRLRNGMIIKRTVLFFRLQEEARQHVLRKISENLRVKEEIRRQKLLAYGRRSKNLSSASLCTFQLGNREGNSSEVIHVGNLTETALCCQENKGLVPTPRSVELRSVVLKPSFMKKRVGDASFAVNNKKLKPRGASPRTTFLNFTRHLTRQDLLPVHVHALPLGSPN